MKKSDLKNGAVVELRNGDRYLKVDDTLLHLKLKGQHLHLGMYNDNLCCHGIEPYKFTIMKVNNDVDNGYGSVNKALCKVYNHNEWTWIRNEKSKLTNDERVILRNVDKNCKWIARDKSGDLFIYKDKPDKKENKKWCTYLNLGFLPLYTFNHLFQFIKWEDEDPYSIAELLKCEVEENE